MTLFDIAAATAALFPAAALMAAGTLSAAAILVAIAVVRTCDSINRCCDVAELSWLNPYGSCRPIYYDEPSRRKACGYCQEDDTCPDDDEPDWDAMYPESADEPAPYDETDADRWYADNHAEIEQARYLDFHARNDVAEMEALEAQQRADADFALNGYAPDHGLWISENLAVLDGTLLACHRRTCATCGEWATHIHPRDPDGRRCIRCRGNGYDPDEEVRDGEAPEDCCHRCCGSGMEIRYTICTVIDAPTVRARPDDDPFQVPAHRQRR